MLGMVSVVAGTDKNDVAGAFAILGLLQDDNKFKQRLQELIDLANEAEKAQTAAEAARTAAEQLGTTAQKALVDAGKLHDEGVAAKKAAEDVAAANQAEMAKREASLSAGYIQLQAMTAKAQTDLAAATASAQAKLATDRKKLEDDQAAWNKEQVGRLDAVDRAMADIQAREAAVAAAEKKLRAGNDALAKDQANMIAKLAKLRDIVG